MDFPYQIQEIRKTIHGQCLPQEKVWVTAGGGDLWGAFRKGFSQMDWENSTQASVYIVILFVSTKSLR